MATDGINYRTDDPDKWGTGEGRNLHPVEVDSNFYELYSRLKGMEDNPPSAVSINNIQVNGSQLMFFMDDGSTFGPFTLPVATFQLRGAYEIGQTYYELDMVTVPDKGLYLVRLQFTAEDPFDPDATDGDGNKLFLPLFTIDYYTYTIGMFFPSRFGAGFSSGDTLMGHMFATETFLDINAPGGVAKIATPDDAADTDVDLYYNDEQIGTIHWDAGDQMGAITCESRTFAPGDLLRVVAPSGMNTQGRDCYITLIAQKTPITGF